MSTDIAKCLLGAELFLVDLILPGLISFLIEIQTNSECLCVRCAGMCVHSHINDGQITLPVFWLLLGIKPS